MKIINLLLSTTLLLTSWIAEAKDINFRSPRETSISIPENSKFEFDEKQSSKGDKVNLYFSGETSIKGILQIYWLADTETDRSLLINFFPDQGEISKLPTLKESNAIYTPEIIELSASPKYKSGSHGFSEEKIRKLLSNQRLLIPENVFRYKERYALIPATVKINKLAAWGDCDSRSFAATFLGVDEFSSGITPPEMEKLVKSRRGTCGPDYTEGYSMSAKTGEKIDIRIAPDIYSSTITQVPNETSFIKIKTVNDNWMYIQFENPESDNEKTSPPQFGYIHTPELNLTFTN